MATNTFEGNKTVSPNHKKLGGSKPKIDKNVKYADAPAVKPDNSKSLSDARDKFAPNADKPTTAAGETGITDLPQLIQKVDPSGKAQVLPQMYRQLMQMTSILGMGSGMGGGSGSQQQSAPPIPAGISVVIEDSFTGALAILTKKYNFERVIEIFTAVLSNNGINNIDSRFQKIVKNAVANLIKVALYYGPLHIPTSVYDETIYGDIVPSPLVSKNQVPDLYVKQYYNINENPYPGYEHWLSPDKKSSVYVKLEPKSYTFSSANEEIYSISEREIAIDLDPYVRFVSPLTLTASILNDILLNQVSNVDSNISNFNMGNNTGGSGGNNNLIGMLGGQLQQLLSIFQSEQLPTSVLNQGDIQKVLQQFTKDMSFNNQLFELGNQAMGGGMGGSLNSLMNMGGLSNIMSGFGIGGGGISGILGGNLLGSFGGFGGSSGGGGGGAGSGFPGATGGGSYSGGGISNTGMKNISQLLTLLGIS